MKKLSTTATSTSQIGEPKLVRRRFSDAASSHTLKTFVLAVLLLLMASACGGDDDTAEGPPPTPTPAPMVLTGSALDNVDNAPTPVPIAAPEPEAIDCEVHADNPDTDCVDGDHVHDGPDAIGFVGFDDSLWSYEAEYPVWTNITEPYEIEEVVETTVRVARAELAGQDQGFFPHLAARRDAPPYERVGIYSVTVLFAEDPANDPARVVVAIAGETSAGIIVDELVTYHWQWTPTRWIPEWDYLLTPDPTPIPEGDTEVTPTPTPTLEIPESPGSQLCPPGYPYAHKNGKCYANPINPADLLYPVTSQPGAVFPTPPPGAPNALDVLPDGSS